MGNSTYSSKKTFPSLSQSFKRKRIVYIDEYFDDIVKNMRNVDRFLGVEREELERIGVFENPSSLVDPLRRYVFSSFDNQGFLSPLVMIFCSKCEKYKFVTDQPFNYEDDNMHRVHLYKKYRIHENFTCQNRCDERSSGKFQFCCYSIGDHDDEEKKLNERTFCSDCYEACNCCEKKMCPRCRRRSVECEGCWNHVTICYRCYHVRFIEGQPEGIPMIRRCLPCLEGKSVKRSQRGFPDLILAEGVKDLDELL